MSTTRTSDRALASTHARRRYGTTGPTATSRRLVTALASTRSGRLRLARDHRRLHDLGAGHVPDAGHGQADPQHQRDTGLAALALLIPLSARVFDLSFAYVMTLSGVVVAKLIIARNAPGPLDRHGPLVGVGIGCQRDRRRPREVDSFIGTLATGSLILALITMVTHDTTVSSGASSPGQFAEDRPDGRSAGSRYPVLYTLVVAVGIWYLLEATATGRRLYATGFNPRAARLAGVQVNRLRFCRCSRPASSRAWPASCWPRPRQRLPTAGTPTCCRPSRQRSSAQRSSSTAASTPGGRSSPSCFSAPGSPAWRSPAAPQWSQSMFIGVVLIGALAVTGLQRRTSVGSRGSGVHGAGVAGADQPGVASGIPLSEEA